MIPVEYALPCLCSGVGGFLFAVWVLDRFYREVLKLAIDEIRKQYGTESNEHRPQGNE